MSRKLWLLFKRAGWAPFAVLMLHQIVGRMGWRSHTDWLLHFLGGLTIAFFLYHAIAQFLDPKRNLPTRIHLLLTFTAACTTAVFWEFAEFAANLFFRTHIQLSLHETMMDLIYGTLGAGITTSALFLFKYSRLFSPPSSDSISHH